MNEYQQQRFCNNIVQTMVNVKVCGFARYFRLLKYTTRMVLRRAIYFEQMFSIIGVLLPE